MEEDLLTETALEAVTVVLDLHGMHLDAAALAGQLHPDWTPVLGEVISATVQPLQQGRDEGRVEEDVQVSVLSCLPSDKGVDGPPSFTW